MKSREKEDSVGPNHAENMNRFYSRKWQGHRGYWIGIYPPAAQVYALSLVKARNHVIEEIIPEEVGSVLDIGCGIGDLMRLSSPKAQRVVGLDIAETNVRMTRLNLVNDGVTNMSVLIGSAEELPFIQGHFDTIVMADVIEHVREVEAALRECARVLRPGGLFICTTPHSAFQTLLQSVDSFTRIPLKLLRILLGKTSFRRKASPKIEDPAYERFLPTRTLRLALERNGMSPLKYKRICFYPGPEGGGMFGYLMAKLYVGLGAHRFTVLARRIVAVFKEIERIQVLNQKQLWVCQRVNGAEYPPTQSGSFED